MNQIFTLKLFDGKEREETKSVCRLMDLRKVYDRNMAKHRDTKTIPLGLPFCHPCVVIIVYSPLLFTNNPSEVPLCQNLPPSSTR